MYPGRNPEMTYAGIFVKEQKEALEKRGVSCDIFVIDGFKSKANYLISSIKLLIHIKKFNYDAIHAHYGLSGLFTLLMPSKRKWKNVFLTLHGGDIHLEQGKTLQVFLTRLILSRVGCVITLNEKMNTIVSKIRNDYKVLPCGIDSTFFQPASQAEKKNIVLFPGKKERQVKNFDYFLKVINSYKEKYGEIDYITLDGFDRDQVKLLMSTSKALLMTSISEGSPQSIKEALSTDLAVVSSDVGDVLNVIGDTPGTKIFQLSEDPSHVADLLRHAITEANQTPNARRSRILDLGLDNKFIADQLIELYKRKAT
jgi:glycosyltransferase involved in cell wall biosynthesis